MSARSTSWSARASAWGACVPRYEGSGLKTRFGPEEEATTPYFSLALAPGRDGLEPGRDFPIAFNTASRFRPSALLVGPTSTDITSFETSRGKYLVVTDPGSNLVRVFNGDTDQIIAILF